MTFVFERAVVINMASTHKSYVSFFRFYTSSFVPPSFFLSFSLLPSRLLDPLSALPLAHSVPYLLPIPIPILTIDSFCCIYIQTP
jgi:hypothetical protein